MPVTGRPSGRSGSCGCSCNCCTPGRWEPQGRGWLARRRALKARAALLGTSERLAVLQRRGQWLQRRHLRDHAAGCIQLRIADVTDVTQIRLGVEKVVDVERKLGLPA